MERWKELTNAELLAINGGSPMPFAGRAYRSFFGGLWEGLKAGANAVMEAHFRVYH